MHHGGGHDQHDTNYCGPGNDAALRSGQRGPADNQIGIHGQLNQGAHAECNPQNEIANKFHDRRTAVGVGQGQPERVYANCAQCLALITQGAALPILLGEITEQSFALRIAGTAGQDPGRKP